MAIMEIKMLLFWVLVAIPPINAQNQQFLGATNPNCSVNNCLICTSNPQLFCEGCDGNLVFERPTCQCPPSYYQSGDVSCTKCMSNCNECESANVCDNCTTSYIFNGTLCIQCSSNCLECSSSDVCTICEIDYRLFNNTCIGKTEGVGQTFDDGDTEVECLAGCSSCTNAQTCDSCLDGYYINGNICSKCDPDCQTCNGGSSSNCTACFSTFLLQNGSCNTCSDPNCVTCNPSTICSLCGLGFGPNEGNCQSCSANCLDCSANISECVTCEDGYGIVEGECVECLSGCILCRQEDFTNCLSCKKDYYNISGQCFHCPTNCDSCLSDTVCTSCKSGFTLIGDQCFRNCIFPCLTCVNGNPSRCTSCYGGYALRGRTCQVDTSCSATSSCTYCSRGSYLQGGKCLSCQLPSDCARCDASNPSGCTQCAAGYYLKNDSCLRCSGSCSTCTSPTFCTACIDGYFLERVNDLSTGICELCHPPSFCATCIDSPRKCTSCLDGYFLSGAKCISNIRIIILLIFDSNIVIFVIHLNRMKRDFMQSLGPPFAGNLEWITMNRFVPGSLNVTATITVPTNTSQIETQDDIENIIRQRDDFGNVSLISGSTELIAPEPQEPEPIAEAETNVALILGLTIPLFFVLLSLICIIRAKGNPRNDEDEEDIQDDYGQSDSAMISSKM